MAETKPTMRRARIAKNFTDIGTGKKFKAGQFPSITEGQFGNYLAAGLIETPAAEKPDEIA